MFGTIKAQTGEQLVTVNADSLFQVFQNYEKCKVTVRGLKLDTVDLRASVRLLERANAKQAEALENYKGTIIPMFQELERNYLGQVRNEKRKSIKKALTWAGAAGVIGFFLGVSSF